MSRSALSADLPVLPVLVGLLVGFVEFLLSLAPLVTALVRVLLLQLLPVELHILLELLVLQGRKINAGCVCEDNSEP